MKKLSAITGFSRSHLSHTFQADTGCSIGAYLVRVRMEYTLNALAQGKPQKAIAAEQGFSSPTAFGNWFRNNAKSQKKF